MKTMLQKVNASLKKNNKGFTLVELIIVIAIIAVLAAVVAPQYIKYIERSRQATDANTMSEIAHAAEVAYVGDGSTQPTDNTLTVKITSAGAFDYNGTPAAKTLAEAVNKVVAAGSYTFKSALYRGTAGISITVTVDKVKGTASWKSASDDTAPSSVNPTKE